MNLVQQIYIMRKRLLDKQLLTIQETVTTEIQRRVDNDQHNKKKK